MMRVMIRLLVSACLAHFALASGAEASAAASEEGFSPLFNGKDLTGWEEVGSKAKAWHAADGLLYCEGGGGGWLSTAKEYDNFVVRLEYKVPVGGNSGVFIRAPRQGDPAYTGMEIQVLDDTAKQYASLRPVQYTGAIYDVVAPSKRVTKPAGEWNELEITTNHRRVKVRINGELVVDASLNDHKDSEARHPGLKRTKGYIGLQNHGTRLDYRNIRIKSLPAK